jgi:hypothetical protein
MNLAVINRVPTVFLRAVVLFLGLIVLILCVFALPEAWRGGPLEFPAVGYAVQLIVIGMYLTAVPFYVGLWQTLLLLNYIDRSVAFSIASVRSLKTIKWCASVIALFYIAFVFPFYLIAEADDAPGLILLSMVIACAPIAVAVFAAVLERLLQSAIEMKSENDLTV